MRAFANGVITHLSKRMSRKGIYPFLEERLENVAPGSRVLNVGAGGEIERIVRKAAARRNFSVTSSDIDPSRGPDLVDDISRSSIESNAFDAVVMMEVLEHVKEPSRAAAELHRILKPNGVLILSTPFVFPIHDRPFDFYRYTRHGLAYLFEPFEGLSITERNGWAEAIVVLSARLYREPGWALKIFGAVLVLLGLVFYPVAWLLSQCFKTDIMTSGYLLTGTKSAAATTSGGRT